MRGKNYSLNNVNGNRKESDGYYTPYGLTREFLKQEYADIWNSGRSILEPACGDGAIVKELLSWQFDQEQITAYDIIHGRDFLNETQEFDIIISNPPYSLAKEFIYKAKSLAKNYIAYFLPLSYLHGQERLNTIWKDTAFPLARVYVCSRYPMLGDPLREDGKFRTGMQAYAWYVWDMQWEWEPVIRWLNIDKYVLRKGE